MYSQELQEYIQVLSEQVGLEPAQLPFLDFQMTSFVGVLGRALEAETTPPGNLLDISIQLLMLDEGLSDQYDNWIFGIHYLTGLGFEQTGAMLNRIDSSLLEFHPLENDHWYRLSLAMLHYLAGGYRVQALSALRQIIKISEEARQFENGKYYRDASNAFQVLYTGTPGRRARNEWETLLFANRYPRNYQEVRMKRLSGKIRERRDALLGDLGLEDESNWLQKRGIRGAYAIGFWRAYLRNLRERGITTFTREQVGEGFEDWLYPDRNLLVNLPTGSGKTIIGELKTALTLAQGGQVLWMLPTRALVRQVKWEIGKAFSILDVKVEELPTTEDFDPIFAESLGQNRFVAVTTPEKLSALIRANPGAILNVGLVVLDEAQILFDLSRGTTAELALQELKQLIPNCKFALMSAYWDALERFRFFMRELTNNDFQELLSRNRPTRHIYGVITNTPIGNHHYPIIELYPPGLQAVDDKTENPYEIILSQRKCRLPRNFGPTDLSQKFSKATSFSGLRTVLFVQSKVSAESQAEKISRGNRIENNLPGHDIARLRIELGRESVIENPARKGVAPHHGGFSHLEQMMVEKWIKEGLVLTAVATPTLAQGVNLPFDISVLSYLHRFESRTNPRVPLKKADILNMLGRAGRAGQVSDGICLIAVKSENFSPQEVLDNNRRYFFSEQEAREDLLGLARLMAIANQANVDDEDWVSEMGGVRFSEAQTLLSFVVTTTRDQDDYQNALLGRLKQFPSIIQLVERGIILDSIIQKLMILAKNIYKMCEGDNLLLQAIQSTGLPHEILRSFLTVLREDYDNLTKIEEADRLSWGDSIIRIAIDKCGSRQWYKDLLGEYTLDDLIVVVNLWRSGSAIVDIENAWQLRDRDRYNRIKIGDFLNHELALFAQFWGALELCEKLLYGDNDLYLTNIQTYVREGVVSMAGLEWKKALGWIDRVLTHRMVEITPPDIIPKDLEGYINSEMRRWNNNDRIIPKGIEGLERQALIGILNEKFS